MSIDLQAGQTYRRSALELPIHSHWPCHLLAIADTYKVQDKSQDAVKHLVIGWKLIIDNVFIHNAMTSQPDTRRIECLVGDWTLNSRDALI